jgi:hypothetical protein
MIEPNLSFSMRTNAVAAVLGYDIDNRFMADKAMRIGNQVAADHLDPDFRTQVEQAFAELSATGHCAFVMLVDQITRAVVQQQADDAVKAAAADKKAAAQRSQRRRPVPA